MFKQCVISLMLVGSAEVFAAAILDVYGTNPMVSEQIIKKYGAQINQIEEAMNPSSPASSQKLDHIVTQKMAIIERIKKEWGFVYGDWSTVFYPDHEHVYTTIEVVDKKDVLRSDYIKAMQKDDLIQSMITYQMLAFKLMVAGELGKDPIQCPFYHCFTGFEHPQLKPYLPIFKAGAMHDKTLVLKTLKSDLDPNRRAVAALLVGHFAEPNEIVRVLLPYINDADLSVRNNAIRVIGETITRGKLMHINVLPFIVLLDSPVVSDRNKSLLVLLSAIDSNDVKQQIQEHGIPRLLKLLALKQPNNHEPAYLILKKVSGKDFGENDLAAWQAWAKTNMV